MSKKSIVWGALGSAALLAVYFGILSVSNSLNHAITEFLRLWPFIIGLSVAFGAQIGLYVFIGWRMKAISAAAKGEIAATGGVSSTSMVACCAHHLTDVAPLVGLTAATAFLAQYQIPFMLIGLFSSLFGIQMMLNIIKKNGLLILNNNFSKLLLMQDFGSSMKATLLLAITVVGLSIFVL